MRLISQKLKQQLLEDPTMRKCTLSRVQDLYGSCKGRKENPEWHHVWQYGGKQINEVWAILSSCTYHHQMVDVEPEINHAFKRYSLLRTTEKDLAKYPKKNWGLEIKRLL